MLAFGSVPTHSCNTLSISIERRIPIKFVDLLAIQTCIHPISDEKWYDNSIRDIVNDLLSILSPI